MVVGPPGAGSRGRHTTSLSAGVSGTGEPFLPFANGGFGTASKRFEFQAETLAVTERFAVAEPAKAGTEIRLRIARERSVRFIACSCSLAPSVTITVSTYAQFRGGGVRNFEDGSETIVSRSPRPHPA